MFFCDKEYQDVLKFKIKVKDHALTVNFLHSGFL